MTNGNSAEIAGELWEAATRCDYDEFKEMVRNALSVCADGGKGEAVAWRIFDGEGNYDYVEDEPSECNVNYAARYGRKYEPLFTAPQAECAPLDKQEAVASVYQNKIGETYVQFDIENAEDIPVGTKLYLAEPIAPRADAEKDAALTESDISRIWLKTTGTYASDCPWDVHGFARAILAATKEK